MEKRKEKKKADLEQLLNSLIEKGWKPRGENVNKVIKTGIDEFGDGYVLFDGELNGYKQRGCNMTELVSKGSGLWQFVCENKLVKPQVYAWYFYREGMGKEVCKEDYEYRLIETALTDEDKLEQFLLDNIKVDVENRGYNRERNQTYNNVGGYDYEAMVSSFIQRLIKLLYYLPKGNDKRKRKLNRNIDFQSRQTIHKSRFNY